MQLDDLKGNSNALRLSKLYIENLINAIQMMDQKVKELIINGSVTAHGRVTDGGVRGLEFTPPVKNRKRNRFSITSGQGLWRPMLCTVNA